MIFRMFVFLLIRFIKCCLWIAYTGNVLENYFDNGLPWDEAKNVARQKIYEVDPEVKRKIKQITFDGIGRDRLNRHTGNK